MPLDEDGEGQGLAMLRLEARRYKREMQQIWMQRGLYEQKKSAASFSSEDSSRIPRRWRFTDTFTTSPSTSGTPMFWNREDAAVSHFEKLAIVEEGTQTDAPLKSEVQTETEKLQYDADLVLNMGESRTRPSTAHDLPVLKTCTRRCDELRSRISQEAACECLADASVRVNADVVFTAKPKRVAVGSQETPECNSSRFFRLDEKETVSQKSTIATSPTGSLNKGQKSTDPVQYFRTGLRGLVSPVRQHDSACSPIHNLQVCGARFRSLTDISKDSTPREMFSWQQDRSEPERCPSIPPPTFSTQVSTPRPEAFCGGTKAGDIKSAFSTEISARSNRVRTELTGEGAMAARLATRIKHALEAIGGKTGTRSTNSTFNLPCRATQSFSACRLLHKDECPEMKLFEDPGKTCGGKTLDNTETASSDSSLPRASQHARKVPVSSSRNHSSTVPGNDADVYFQNVIAALSTDRYNSNQLSGSCTAGEVSPARAVRRAERRAEAARSANTKSCAYHHASHQPDGVKISAKSDACQSGSNHSREKQSMQKLRSVAETAKRLYTDLVDCAYDELGASTDCGNPVNHQDGDRARDVCKFARTINESCPSIGKRGMASTDNDEVCGRCHVCQTQFILRDNHQECTGDTAPPTCRDSCPCDTAQPLEEAQADSLGETTIHLSDVSPTIITLPKNDCTKRPGYKVEISTPHESPCQRECSPKNRGENIVRGAASWKDSCTSAMRRTRNNQQVKKSLNKCLLDPCCDGPRDSCHMSTRLCRSPTGTKCSRASPRNSYQMPSHSKCSGASAICVSQPIKGANECRLDPCCVGARDSCHMPTYATSFRASCGPRGGSRLKQNNGTKMYDKDPSVLPRCPVHCRRGVESTKGKLESNSCRGKIRIAGKVHRNILHDDIPRHTLLLERKVSLPGLCGDISKFPKGRVGKNSKVRPFCESRDHKDLCMVHNDVRSSSMKGKENADGGREETAGPRHSSGGRMYLNSPVKNVHRSFQGCSRIGGVRSQSTLTATEVIEKEHAFVGNKTRQPSGRYMTGNAPALSEAHKQSIQPHEPPSDLVDRAAAAAGLAREIEAMIAYQLGKPNRKSNYLISRRKLPEAHNESFGRTNLDVGIIAAANAVKNLKPVSLLPGFKKNERNRRATPRKGTASRATLMAEDGSDFFDQMHKELEELALRSKQLGRKEGVNFQSQSLLNPRQEHDRHSGFSIKGRSLCDLKNLANADTELEETRKSVGMQRSEAFPSFWDEPIGSQALGSKRLRNTSPARGHSNKLLRLNVGKAESQAGRMKQDQHSEESVNRMRSSFGGWKPPPKESEAKNTTKSKLFATRKVRPPAWVERMSKARNVFTSLLRPMLRAQCRKEMQLKPTFGRSTLQPPGFMVTSSVKSKLFGKHIPGRGALQPNPSRIQRKNPIAPIQYDINTGRKIVHVEREPGELLYTSVENRADAFSSFKSLDEKNIRITRRPIVKIGMTPSAVTNSGRYHLRVKGWNADPLIRSDIPHKPADIIRYNRNGGLDVQVRRRDPDGKHKTIASTSVGHRNVRQVTFAGMAVHNSHNEGKPKGLRAPHRSDSLHTLVTNKKLITSQPRRVKNTLRKRSSSSATRRPRMRDPDKIHRYGGGGGQWIFHEGFWTEMLESEKGFQDDSPQSLMTPGSMAPQLGTPILELKSAQVIENETLKKPAERVGGEEYLTTASLVSGKSMDEEDGTRMIGEIIALEGEGESQNHALFKSLGLLGSDGGGIVDHSSVVAMKASLCSARRNEEDQRAESCSELELTMPKKQIQVRKSASNNQERRKREPSSNEFLQPPLRLPDEVFPDRTENETLVSMFDCLQESTSVQIEAQSDEQWPAFECISGQTSLAHEQEGKLKEIELERTLMDIVLCTILQDDTLQDQEVFATRVEPISLPVSRRSTDHDNLPDVDRATELDNSFFCFKDQDCQTTNAELLAPSIQRFTSPTQETCSAKVKSTQVHHRATGCEAPWSTVGIQTTDTTTISATSPGPPAALPILMPFYFQQWGTSILPTALPTNPTVHFELPVRMTTSSDVLPPPASAVNSSFPAAVSQGSQATESHVQLNSKEFAAPRQVSKLPINSRAARGQLCVLEEESDSDWELELNGGISPSTPSMPLSSPEHKSNLKKAMELYPVNSSTPETPFAREDLQPSILEACQTLVSKLTPPIQMVTETIIEDITVDEPPQTMAVNEMRRGTSWAKVKEMQAATLALIRAASTKTASATSLSEYSCESSPEFHTWISPGEVNIEEVERSRTGLRFVSNAYNTRTFQEDLGKPSQSHAWGSFGSGRASAGEIYNAVRFLGLLSDGEVEAGMVSTLDEPGQIQIGSDFVLHSRTDLQGQGSEPGEFQVDADASSSQQSP